MTSNGSRSKAGWLLAGLVVALLASLFAAGLVPSQAGGRTEVPWYIGMALLSTVGIVGVLLAARRRSNRGVIRATVVVASVGMTILATAHWLFIVSRVFSGLTILIAVVGAVCVVLAIRWQRSSSGA